MSSLIGRLKKKKKKKKIIVIGSENSRMIDLADLLWGFSLLSIFLHFLHVLKEAMAVTTTLPSCGTATSSSAGPSSSSSSSPSSSILCFGLWTKLLGIWSRYSQYYLPDQTTLLIKRKSSTDQYSPSEGNSCSTGKKETGDQINSSNCLEMISNPEESSFLGLRDLGTAEGVKPSTRQESGVFVNVEDYYSSSSCEAAAGRKKEEQVCIQQVPPGRTKKRPSRIIIPGNNRGFEASDVEAGNDSGEKDFQVQGREYCLASRRGRKRVMEDGYGVITNISGDSKQAFFGVYDGHGGRAAVDHVVDKLGTNILRALEEQQPKEKKEEITRTLMAVREGYLTTDKEFLAQGLGSGACAATVLIKDGEVVVANVGDCRVVLSRKGDAHALTSDHRPDREDERVRIENSGGYVNNHNGVWRVHGSLAISRAIGDSHMKDWIISEPEMSTIGLDPDCEFLIVASDGLWDKVGNQEAVDVVLKHKYSVESCKKLVEMACSRGNKDDITVMVVALQNFNSPS